MLLVLLVGCGGGSGGSGGSTGGALAVTSVEINPFLPITTAMEWKYSGQTDSTIAEEARLISGVTVDSLLYPTGNREYYVTTSDAIYLRGF